MEGMEMKYKKFMYDRSYGERDVKEGLGKYFLKAIGEMKKNGVFDMIEKSGKDQEMQKEIEFYNAKILNLSNKSKENRMKLMMNIDREEVSNAYRYHLNARMEVMHDQSEMLIFKLESLRREYEEYKNIYENN